MSPRSILDGVDEKIDRALGLGELGRAPLHALKSASTQLSQSPVPGFGAAELIQDVLDQIELNHRGVTRSPSTENWRFRKMLKIAKRNSSAEKRLEKRIVAVGGESWVNQVPTASGIVGPGERHRNVDLVEKRADGEYDFVELKVASDTPLFAAFEILKYGLVFLDSYMSRDALGYNKAQNPLMWAEHVALVVLAPSSYYNNYDFRWIEEALDGGLREVIERSELRVPPIRFRFERFPSDFDLGCDDTALRAALARRGPVF